MKKKLFATLGALCLGVILCVSSVFAANWWYSIQNTGGTASLTFGKAITLSINQNGGAAEGVYQNSQITFNAFRVDAKEWDEQLFGGVESDQHTNTTLPKFNIVIKAYEGTEITAESVAYDATTFLLSANASVDGVDKALTIGTEGAVIEDIQAGTEYDVVLSIVIKDELPESLATKTFTFKAEIVKA